MEWISIKDRLPYNFQEVIVYSEDGGVEAGVYYSEGCFDYYDDSNRLILVNLTHWMPLPQPPKQDAK